ncbi:MAG: sulfatase-like hydrolase/transferase [Rikenellaceae bacterium]
MNKLYLGAASMSLLCLGSCAESNVAKPNILMIIVDDAGYNDFGFMGSQDLETPNIDKLASNGIVFTDAHVSASVSGPSRAGMLTGRYQQRNGYECNLDNILGLGLEESTIADLLSAEGYSTACIGKWHQGDGAEYHPNRRGFDHFFGFISGSRSYFYRPNGNDKPGANHALQLNGVNHPFDGYMTDVLADGANEYITKCADKSSPFFMYLAFNAVHTPMEATEEDLARYEGHPRQVLAAMTWALDRAVGSVVENLEQHNLMDNTLIFFVSDNGGAHNNQSSNFPLKGFKGNKFEGGHRVPFFMCYADKYKGHYDGLTSSLDMAATALTLAGVDTKGLERPLDGVDLIPYLNGKVAGEPHNQLFWRKEDMAAARSGAYKLIRVKGVGERLYNVENNYNEDDDLREQEPEITANLQKALNEWEKGLITPILWNEGIWNDVTREIHRDLMENRPVSCYTPEQLKKQE